MSAAEDRLAAPAAPPEANSLATLASAPRVAAGFAETLAPPSAPAGAAETLDPADTGRPQQAGPLPDDIPGYELLGELGRGGMGVVYKARQRVLHRLVALKMIIAGEYANSQSCVRFLSEAEAIARLHHPNIIQIYELGQHKNVPFFSLEYLEGGSLDRRLDGRPQTPAEAARIIETLARAVQAAHQQGIVHRDLKPGNILLDSDGTLKITDFGLAKQVEGGSGVTASGSILGTPSYMAPEQAKGDIKNIGAAADIYALGAILYELLTGRPPFRSATPLDTVMQVTTQEPVAPRALVPKVPRDLETVCLKCLQKDPAKRYDSALALAEDLRRFRAGEGIQARPVPRYERALRWSKRHPAAAALVLVSVAAALLLLLGAGLHNRQLAGALKDADAQRKRAEANLDERFQMVDDLLFNIDGRLANMEGTASLRVEFLDEARKLNAKLRQEQPDDDRILRQAGRIALGMGEIYAPRDPATAQQYLDQAIDVQQQLVDRHPDDASFLDHLAQSLVLRGRVNARLKRLEPALADFQQAATHLDRLVQLAPGRAEYSDRAVAARLHPGDALAAAGKSVEAVASFREAERLAGEFVRERPAGLLSRRHALAAASLAYAVEATDPAEAQKRFRDAIASSRAAAQEQPTGREELQRAYFDLQHHFMRRHDHAGLERLAAEYMKEFPDDGDQTYNAVCMFALAAREAQKASELPEAERSKLVDRYVKEALDAFHSSIEQGNTEFIHAAVDSDLDSLRDRADYRAFMTLQEKRFPAKAATPAALITQLETEYTNRYQNYRALRGKATLVDRRRAEHDPPVYGPVARRLLELAKQNPQLPSALSAVTWVLESAPANATPADLKLLRGQAVELLRKDHLGKAAVSEVCRIFSENPSSEGDGVLQQIAETNAAADAKGLAIYSLGLSLMQQADAIRPRDPAEADRLAKRAEAQLEKIVGTLGAASLGSETLADTARKKLHELRTLSIGRVAREIEGVDFDGKTFKLSDYRGQVVLVDFWANWCGFCRQMFPGEKALVERMNGRPFALLGVNCDDGKEAALRAVRQQKLNWRSWFDGSGGPIGSAWQIDSFPQMYLIDHRGVIRKKWQGRTDESEIDAAVEELLKEAEAGAGSSAPTGS